MAKTSLEVCTEALRMLGVAAFDEAASAAEITRARDHMTDIFDTLNNTEGLAFDWTIETVPDGAFLSFARAIAGSLAASYSMKEPTMQRPSGEVSGYYRVGIEGIRRFAAPDMTHDKPTLAVFF